MWAFWPMGLSGCDCNVFSFEDLKEHDVRFVYNCLDLVMHECSMIDSKLGLAIGCCFSLCLSLSLFCNNWFIGLKYSRKFMTPNEWQFKGLNWLLISIRVNFVYTVYIYCTVIHWILSKIMLNDGKNLHNWSFYIQILIELYYSFICYPL